VLPESRLEWCTQVFENAIRKSAHDSTWLVERDSNVDAYCERRLYPRWILKIQRLRAYEEAERAWEARRAQKLASEAEQEANVQPKQIASPPKPKRQKLA